MIFAPSELCLQDVQCLRVCWTWCLFVLLDFLGDIRRIHTYIYNYTHNIYNYNYL